MQTVDKAFVLLSLFSESRPEVGLSELARSAKFDKATTRRLLKSLANHGLIEQNPDDRRYRLGPELLRLARVREATIPMTTVLRPTLERLAEQTKETAHFALLSGRRISTVDLIESSRSNRVTMEFGEQLPLHATATGLVILANSGAAFRDDVLRSPLPSYTNATLTGATELKKIIGAAKRQGYVISDGYYEADVCSIAAPVFDRDQKPIGAIAVAAPSSRFDENRKALILSAVVDAAADATSAMGGSSPQSAKSA